MAAGGPPRPGAPRPGGPPPRPGPGGAPPGAVVRGVGAPAPRAGGPPPPQGPPANFKPPPIAPPPRTLIASTRPDVDKVKMIQPRGAPPPRGLPGQTPIQAPPNMPGNLPARGAPRALAPEFKQTEYEGERAGPITSGAGARGAAAGAGMSADPKQSARGPGTSRKAGSISMFDESAVAAPAGSEPKRTRTGASVPFNPGMQLAPGQKAPEGILGPPRKPTADPTTGEIQRTTRPGAPDTRPPGIPDGSSLPPDAKPKDKKNAPPPVRQVADRGRAPPRIEPGVKQKPPDPAAPHPDTAPTKRGKVVKEEVVEYVPRREREHPEFESSSDEEDDKPAAKKSAPAPAPVPTPKKVVTPKKEVTEITPSAAEQAEDRQAKNAMAVDMGKEPEPEPEVMDVDAPPVLELDEEDREPAPPVNIPQSMGVSLTASTFVPPPPAEYEPEFDTSKISQELTPGRLSIRCIEGINVRRKDEVNKIPKQDPFLKLKLGTAERHPWKATSVQRKCDDNPSFKDEVVFFDILDPSQFVFNGDLQLQIECWNKGTFKEEPMGAITLSVVRFCKQPFIAYEEKLPLLYPGQKTSSSKVVVEIVFEEARPGIFSFKLYDAKSLRNVDPMGQQHPYIKFKLGPQYQKRSKTIKNSGISPYFAEEEVLMWADRESWKDDLQIMILDEDLGNDKPIGMTSMCLLPI